MEEKILETLPYLLLSPNDPASRETLLLSLFSDRVSLLIHFCLGFFLHIYTLFDKIPFSSEWDF